MPPTTNSSNSKGDRRSQIARQLEERRRREEAERHSLCRSQVTEAERQERLAMPIEDVISSFANFFGGEYMGKTSLAMHAALFPDSPLADQASEEELEDAKERLKRFNPVSVWKA